MQTAHDLQAEIAESLPRALARLLRALPTGSHEGRRLTPEQYAVLITLAAQGPLPMHALAAAREIAVNTATTVVDRLAMLGLVERAPEPADRRVVLVRLTAAGRELALATREARLGRLRTLFAELSGSELATLAAALEIVERVVERGAEVGR